VEKKLEGYKFRREHIIGGVIVDFLCLAKKLVIEVDGGYHESPEQIGLDKIRTDFLNNLGYQVIRFTNDEVNYDIERVLNKIVQALAILPIRPNRDMLPPLGARGQVPCRLYRRKEWTRPADGFSPCMPSP
jgi:very-short-patch-repair endonuclease